MGGQQSQKKEETINIINNYNLEKKDVISEKEFTVQIFKILDNHISHTSAGPIFVTQTYVLKAFFDFLNKQKKGYIQKDRLIEVIEKIYKQPEKAIQYSHRIIASDREKITRKDFADFIEKSLDKGIESILKRNKYDPFFENSLKDWLRLNKPKLMIGVDKIFVDNGQGNPDYWSLGDFKRWIMDNNHWTLYIEIKNVAYKIPLNIPCLFGVSLQRKKSEKK